MDFEEYRISNRHLSESQVRDRYCERTGRDRHDLDHEVWRERERRNDHYREVDGF